MQALTNSLGKPLVILGGTTAYATVAPAVTSRVNGQVETALVNMNSGSIEACIHSAELGVQMVEVYADGSAIGIRIDQSLTRHAARQSIAAVLELMITLTSDLTPTRYKAGDVVGFRFSFTIETPLVLDENQT